jgi:hypothetical protein
MYSLTRRDVLSSGPTAIISKKLYQAKVATKHRGD